MRNGTRKGAVQVQDVRPGMVLWSELDGAVDVTTVQVVEHDEVRYGKLTGRKVNTIRIHGLKTVLGLRLPTTMGDYPYGTRVQVVKRTRPTT